MEKVVTVSKSFADSDRLDKAYYRALHPRERMIVLLELNRRWPESGNVENSQRLERVYRITQLS